MVYSQSILILFTIFNSIVYLNAQYRGTPSRGTRLEAALGRTFELKCEYDGEGKGGFVDWRKKNATHDVSVNTDKPGHYVVKHKEKESTLLIKIFVTADANVQSWYVKTDKQGYEQQPVCEFGPISMIASPQGIIDDKNEMLDASHGSFRRNEDQSINLKCLIEPSSRGQVIPVLWQYSKDDKTYSNIPDGAVVQGDELHIDKVQKYHRGYYRCSLNKISFTILLRVKDRLAALWPAIGILGVVLALVIIILIFEKRQKTNKKPASTDDDDHDRASDQLLRTTSKTSDNDNKKRVVKA